MSGWVRVSSLVESLTHLLTQVVLTSLPKVSTIRVSGWVRVSSLVESSTHLLTQVVLTSLPTSNGFSLKCFRVQRARHLFQSSNQTRPGPRKIIVIDFVDAIVQSCRRIPEGGRDG